MKRAFTLAEVLITLGIIGVVAAITLPTFFANIRENIQNEQVRTIKYKLTLATDKMKSLDLINYGVTTEDFVKELSKHYKIAKVCESNPVECWPTEKINTHDTEVLVRSIQTGEELQSIAPGSKYANVVGIITGDGVPMLLTFSPKCTQMDSNKTYTWSVFNNKPVTNATTNCISAIFDINGKKGPNKVGKDIRTLNSLLGYYYTNDYNPITKTEQSNNLKEKLGLKYFYPGNDYYAGARKVCLDKDLHMPDEQTLINMAGATRGRTDIGIGVKINSCETFSPSFMNSSCVSSRRISGNELISIVFNSIYKRYWSNHEISKSSAYDMFFWDGYVSREYQNRYGKVGVLCVGD